MSKNRLIAGILVAVVCASITSQAFSGDEWRPSSEFAEVQNRIVALAKTDGLSVAEKQQRLQELNAVAQEVDRTWRDKEDVEGYSRLTLQLVGSLGSMDGTGLRGGYLAQSWAIRALEKADEMPLEVECSLVSHVQHDRDAQGKVLAREALDVLRKTQARQWLRAWQRIDQTIDKQWNPADTGVANVSPPDGSPAGVAPEAIADPRLRAQYVAEIQVNRQKIAKATLQRRARDLEKHWLPSAKRFLITAYSETPERIDELQALLEQFVTNVNDRAQILDAVRGKKMPDSLELRNTTQPAK